MKTKAHQQSEKSLKMRPSQKAKHTEKAGDNKRTSANQRASLKTDSTQGDTKRSNEVSATKAKQASPISTIGVWELDLRRNRLEWSDALFPIFGIRPDQFEGTFESFLELVHPDDRKKVLAASAVRVSSKREKIINLEYRVQRSDGSVVTLYDQGQIYFDKNGKPIRADGVVIDISGLKVLEEHHRAIFEQSAIAKFVVTEDGQFVETNGRFRKLVGYSEAEFERMLCSELTHPDDRTFEESERARLSRGIARSFSWEKRFLRKDGSVVWVDLTLSRLDLGQNPPLFAGAALDISQRKESDRLLADSRRALEMLSKCNEALIRTSSEVELLNTICRIAVEVGGYRMASVLYANQDKAKTVVPTACWGECTDYLKQVSISWSEAVPEGRGPAGRTVRTAKPCTISNVEDDPGYEPWIIEARKRGFRSVVSLPLTAEGRTFGVFGLYSAEARKVPKEELQLLQELADDLAFGIAGLRTKQEQQKLLYAITTIAEAVSISTGQDFYQRLLCTLSLVLGAHAAIISCIDAKAPAWVRSLCAVIDGTLVPDVVYELSGSPCEELSSKGEVILPTDVCKSYPDCRLMQELAAEAYVGRSLVDGDGKHIGMLYVIFKSPLEDLPLVNATLRVFAARAAGEMIRQMSDSKVREQALLLDKAQDVIVVRDLHHQILYWNHGAERIYEWSAEKALGKNFRELKIFDSVDFDGAMRKVLEEGEWVGEMTAHTCSGKAKTLECSWTLVKGENGATDSVLAINTDITERKKSEAQLHLLEASVERLSDIILITEADPIDEPGPKIVYVNDSFYKHMGYTKEEVIGRSPRFLQGPLTSREELDRIRQALVERKPVRAELINYTKGGEPIWLDLQIVPLVDARGALTHFVAVQRDVTERKRTDRMLQESEARLAQVQRLESLGQLTGGIAHDFNNLLTVILGNAEMLTDQLQQTPHLMALSSMIRTAGMRGAELISRLLAFARKQALEPKATQIGDAVDSMIPLLRRAVGENINIIRKRTDDGWLALVDQSQLEAAILNLCINARDAMPDGGQLILESSRFHLDEDLPDSNGQLAAGDYVLLTVSDTGSGIPPEAINHVFEPFFTTKPKGKGTGLGLSMVYGFTRQSGGQIKIYSELNTGTIVKLFFPRTETITPAIDEESVAIPEMNGVLTVLLVEDDDLVRRHAESLLVDLGYRVVTANNGPEAMRIAESGVPFDLLFTDLMMPGGMNGVQLAAQARTLRPDLPVLLTSGYSEIVVSQQSEGLERLIIVHKPYSRKELLTKIRQSLHEGTLRLGGVL